MCIRDRDKSGHVKNTLHNLTLILENDPNLKGVVFNPVSYTHLDVYKRQLQWMPPKDLLKLRRYNDMSVNLKNPTKVVNGVVRLSYANVWEPASINGSNPKYSVSLIIPKTCLLYTSDVYKRQEHSLLLQ